MKVTLDINGQTFTREIPDQYYETLRDLLIVFERHEFKPIVIE